jgi:hypothetical protein
MRGGQHVGKTVAFAGLIAATAFALYAFAQHAFTAHLRDQAAHALALAASGGTPYRWRFGDDEDIVAGRVFGARAFEFREHALIAQSSGTAFEIGLPLLRAMDLSIFPHLQIAAAADAPALFDIVVREALDAPELVLSGTPLAAGISPLSIDLSRDAWLLEGRHTAAPKVAAMLRLRVHLPTGAHLHLKTADLLRAEVPALDLRKAPQAVDVETAVSADRTPVFRLPFRSDVQSADIAAIAHQADPSRPPLILLPQRGRVEQQIALRNAVFAAMPGAILVPEAALEATFAQARAASDAAPASDVLRWTALALYACALLWSRLRPAAAPRVRAAIEGVLALLGPLWLILFDDFTGNPDAAQSLLIMLGAAYAISLSLPRRWNWNGSARIWMLAFGIVAFALLLGMALHDGAAPARAISPSHSARYIVWAFVQQYLVCAVCTERWRIATGSGAIAAYLGALGFALLHTPNAALMIATFAAGLCWCAIYLKDRALLPLAVSHAGSALLLLALLPRSLLASAEVSARFFQ